MTSTYRSTQNITQAFSAQRPYANPYKMRTRFIDTVAADNGTDDGILSVVENPDCSSADLPCNVETPDGKRVIEIPVFDSMTKFMMSPQGMNQRLPLYTYLNEQLRKGRLSRIVGFPVLNRVINRVACEFTGFSYWEITRYEFITDISVKLTLESYDGIHEWNGVLVCSCGFSHQFYLIAEELTASTKEEREGFTPLDSHLIQVYKGAQIDLEAERMWVKYKLPEALTNPKMRKARRLAEKMGLTVLRLPIYEHKGLNSILFFEEGTLLVGADRVVKDEDGHEVIIKDDHGEPVTIPANTIVVNSNRIAEEYEDFPIFHECYHYEKHYLAFRLQKLTCSDNRKIKKKKIVVQQGVTQKDYLFFMENHADRAAHGLMMPATDTRNRIQAQLALAKNYQMRNTLGYRMGSDGKPVIVEEEAEIVRKIFSMFADGISMGKIANYMTEHHVPRRNGDTFWSRANVNFILRNEKYVGDAILQKSYTVNCLTHERKVNTGKKHKYFLRDCHDPIIDRDTWDRVHLELARRSAEMKGRHPGKKYAKKYCFSEILTCSCCGGKYKRTIWRNGDKKMGVWRCGTRMEGSKKICGKSPSLHEDKLQKSVIGVVNEMIEEPERVERAIRSAMEQCRTEIGEIDVSIAETTTEIENISTRRDEILKIITGAAFDQFKEELRDLNRRELEGKDRLEQLQIQKESVQLRIKKAVTAREMFMNMMPLECFDEEVIPKVVERIDVVSKTEIRIVFRGGVEVEGKVEK